MMETVFDHDISDDEQLELFGEVISKQNYLSMVTLPASALDAIHALYVLRGDIQKAEEYMNRIAGSFIRGD